MANQWNKPPGGKKENPNKKIISCWLNALNIANVELRIKKFEDEHTSEVIIAHERDILRQRMQGMEPETKDFLEEARVYSRINENREVSLETTPLQKLKNEAEKDYATDESGPAYVDDEEEFLRENQVDMEKDITDTLGDFVRILATGELQGRLDVSVKKALLNIVCAIAAEIRDFDFKTEAGTTERKIELKMLTNLNSFLIVLRNLTKELDIQIDDQYTEDWLERLKFSLTRTPAELVRNLWIAFRVIVRDLATRQFPPLPGEPEKVRLAMINLGRSSNAIN